MRESDYTDKSYCFFSITIFTKFISNPFPYQVIHCFLFSYQVLV